MCHPNSRFKKKLIGDLVARRDMERMKLVFLSVTSSGGKKC